MHLRDSTAAKWVEVEVRSLELEASIQSCHHESDHTVGLSSTGVVLRARH
jgi:hypothetical protein